MSIADNPSSWTSKPKDNFGSKVKDSLDKRGWGEVDTSIDPSDKPAQEDDGRQHTIDDYRSMRSRLDDVRSHCRMRARMHERNNSTREAKEWKDLEQFVDGILRGYPMDGGTY